MLCQVASESKGAVAATYVSLLIIGFHARSVFVIFFPGILLNVFFSIVVVFMLVDVFFGCAATNIATASTQKQNTNKP